MDIDNAKIPPNSVDSEQSVLGGLLLHNDSWDSVVSILGSDDFYQTSHRIIYDAIVTLLEHDKPADILTVKEQVIKSHDEESIGGFAYLAQIAENTPSVSNIEAYAKHVRELSIYRQLTKICKELGILTVCIVTLPFNFEGPKKMSAAMKGISTMRNFCDTLIVIPNEKLLSVIDYNTTLEEGFAESDSVLLQAAQSISDLINKQGNVNIDFADVETVMSGMGDAVMGTGTARGEERAVLAAQQAICSPLLDNQSIKGAKAALVNVTGNKKMTMREVDAATKLIYEEAGQEVHLIFGCVVDENMDDELKVTVIATGFNRTPIEDIEYKKEIQKNEFHKNTNDLMETSNTTLYNQKNENSLNDENFDDENDGPTLVFDDFDQSADLDVPAYIRKQNR